MEINLLSFVENEDKLQQWNKLSCLMREIA